MTWAKDRKITSAKAERGVCPISRKGKGRVIDSCGLGGLVRLVDHCDRMISRTRTNEKRDDAVTKPTTNLEKRFQITCASGNSDWSGWLWTVQLTASRKAALSINTCCDNFTITHVLTVVVPTHWATDVWESF